MFNSINLNVIFNINVYIRSILFKLLFASVSLNGLVRSLARTFKKGWIFASSDRLGDWNCICIIFLYMFNFLSIFCIKVTKNTFNSSSPSVSPIPFCSRMCVRTAQSLLKGAHILPSSLFFIDHNLCVGTGVRTFPAPFCAYARFINETPGCYTRLQLVFWKSYFIWYKNSLFQP